MINHNPKPRAVSLALLGAVVVGALPAVAQEPAPQDDATDIGTVVVTGSRIERQDYIANSPTMTVRAEQILGNSDITLDTYLNSLPQVNPAGTTTSNNPPNNGQSNIDLRGLGANRNLVLIDGRRPMVSASDMTIDLNTIPQALVESIEIVTGGAGAAYGADAIAGATNIKLKRDFSGFDLRTSYSNSTEEWDAEEYQVSAVLGGNFADDAGNVAIAFDFSEREGMIKSQRDFAAIATATTTFLPEGLYFPSGNGPTQAAVDGVFGGYGVAAGAVPAGASLIGFNPDGSLFSRGLFNNPLDVQNWRYPVDLAVNTNLFPDVYSYNFDSVNILTLPLERRSFLGKFDYEFGGAVEVFAQLGWTEYDSTIAIAPTPTPTVAITAPGFNSNTQATSTLITPGFAANGLPFQAANLLVVPANNPFIPADFAALLATRAGDNLNLVGAGATEAFLMRQRTLSAGLRTQDFENTVVQYLLGARGPLFGENWRWEAYASEGRTEIDQTQGGNIDTQRLQQLLEAPDGGAGACAGGFDPFGRNPISPECVDFLEVSANLTNEFVQQIVQGYVAGDTFDMPAGPLAVVLGAEYRGFEYDFDPGTAGGPISGFNAQNPAAGTNTFKDLFFEALVPIVTNLELNLGYRYSKSEFEDTLNDVSSEPSSDNSYKAELSWQALDSMRLRTSYQRAVRAPNFTELFDTSGSAPQYFDPCSVTSQIRTTGADAADVRQLCIDTGLGNAAADFYVQTPGTQLSIQQAGNTGLLPETADTITFGVVFNSPFDGALERLRGSIDYYVIDIADPILVPDPNMLLSSCFNYFGGNPSYDSANINCQAIIRPAGGDILQMADPGDPDGLYPGINGGAIKTDGIDLQLDYGFEIGNAGDVTMNLLVSYLLSFELQERDDLPTIDYAGSVSYFGEGLGTSYPEWKANLNLGWKRGAFSFAARSRWIDSMENRASLQFPGESFTSPESAMYWDFVAGWRFMENSELRIGVNNAFDEQPPTYAPNVQSGTDPSIYDVIGRRAFGQVNFRF